MPIHPSPISDTRNPRVPSVRCFIRLLLLLFSSRALAGRSNFLSAPHLSVHASLKRRIGTHRGQACQSQVGQPSAFDHRSSEPVSSTGCPTRPPGGLAPVAPAPVGNGL